MDKNKDVYTEVGSIDLNKLNLDQLQKIAILNCISTHVVDHPVKYGMAVGNLEALIFGGKRDKDISKYKQYLKDIQELEDDQEKEHHWGKIPDRQEHKVMVMGRLKFFRLIGELKEKIPLEGVGEM